MRTIMIPVLTAWQARKFAVVVLSFALVVVQFPMQVLSPTGLLLAPYS